jgi:integrase
VRDVRVVDGVARHVRVIVKGNKERRVPLPEAFGRVLALSLAGQAPDDYVFPGSPAASQSAPMPRGPT